MSVLYTYLINYTIIRYKRLESILGLNYILAYKAKSKVNQNDLTETKLHTLIHRASLILVRLVRVW